MVIVAGTVNSRTVALLDRSAALGRRGELPKSSVLAAGRGADDRPVPGWQAGAVTQLDLVDETFVVASPAELARLVRNPARWRQWWPDLDLSVFQDRGEQGIRWNVRGALAGSMEVWLEPSGDGVIVHYYLRCDP